MQNAAKSERLELRLASSEKQAITEAAELIGLSASQFLLMQGLAAVRKVMRTHRPISIAREDFVRLLREDESAPESPLLDQAIRELERLEQKAKNTH